MTATSSHAMQNSDAPAALLPPVRRPRSRLFRKYILLFAVLVGGALLASGGLEIWFSYGENKAALAQLQREKAIAAAARIEQFMDEITRQIGWTTRAQWSSSVVDQRRIEYLQLLRQAPAVTEIGHLDAGGLEELRVSRLAMDATGTRTDFSSDPRFVAAKAHKTWYSPVYFRKESEPYITVAIAGTGRDTGVTVAEVNLKFIWDVISRIKVGQAGYAYVVDARGLLIAHPDIGLVLRKTDFAGLSQVAVALAPPPAAADREEPLIGADPAGRPVLTANAVIKPVDWTVFVDMPLSEAYKPLYESAQRTAALMLLGLALAVLAGLFLARRMVVPIQALQEGAARLGAGDLHRRIDIRTGDELESLAHQFNRMAEDLQESYAGLERKVEERTQELRESLEQQTATAEVLKVISRSPFELDPVLQNLLKTAATLADAEKGWIGTNDNGELRVRAGHGMSAEFFAVASRQVPNGGRGTAAGRALIDGRTCHIVDTLGDPDYTRRDSSIRYGMRSVLAVPLMREGKPIGVIALIRPEVRPFTGREIELTETFADQAVIAIANVRLFDELQTRTTELARSVEELKALGEVGRAVSSTLDLRTVLDTVVARAMQLGEADGCSVFRYKRRTREFLLWHAVGLPPSLEAEVRATSISEGETVMGKAAHAHEPVQIADLAALPPMPLRNMSLAAGYRSALIVPLVRADRIFGALVLHRRRTGDFALGTVNLLSTFASQSSLAIQNARLFREIEEKGRQIEIASAHKSQFLANMSHELRTPLNAILGYTELMLDGLYGELGDKSRSVLERVQANGKHLLGLINDVLDLAKIEAGQLALAVGDYSVKAVVQSVIDATESLARAKGLALTADIAPALPDGAGDERRLTQVLLNVVGNAIKFTDAGSVTVTATADAGFFTIAVADTGPGIPVEEQARIFEEFQQVDNSSTRKKGGSGLGLAISKRIVELHGGTIRVQSTPGHGSTFLVHLPIQTVTAKEVA
ncbi:MAG: GAF domain-containing protein [Alphaproteobacteria bacterium]|nr:GAF domain-containing protein [Alphaproteobacteria bacterium]